MRSFTMTNLKNPREKPQGQGTEDTTTEHEYFYPPCLFCSRNCEASTNETIKRRRKQREQGFRNGVKLLCDVLNVPLQGSLEEALSLPICLLCDQLMRSVFELYRTIKSLEVKLRLKKETIVKHLKSQYRYDNVKDPVIATAALRIRRGFKKALGIDGGECALEHSLKEVKIPEGTTVRDCYVHLERLPKQTHVQGREVEDNEDTAELLKNIAGHSLETAGSSFGRDGTGDEIPSDFNLHDLNAEEEIEVKDEDSDSEQLAEEAEVDTLWGRGGTLEDLRSIQVDHCYALSPSINVPEGVSLRSCSVRLERLPKRANVQFSENSFGKEEQNSPGITPPTPTEHIVNPWERVETTVIIAPEEGSTEDPSGRIYERIESEVLTVSEEFFAQAGLTEVMENSSRPQASTVDQSDFQTDCCQFFCSVCNTGFTTLLQLRLHKKTHGPSRKLQSKTLKSRLRLKKSESDGPVNLRKSKTTEKCAKEGNLKPKASLRKQPKMKTDNGCRILPKKHKEPRPLKCPFVDPEGGKTCNWTFKDEHDVEAHVKRVHLGMKKGHQCPHCPLACESKRRLSEHVKIHTGERGDYVCDICTEAFRMRRSLLVHRVRKHNVQGEFVCDEESCDKSFTSRRELRDHRYIHLGQFPFPCNQCPAGFGTLCLLRVHLKYKHADTFNSICEVCGKQFKNPGNLKRHQRYHSDERPFPCKICPWAFKSQDKLNSHLNSTHSGTRPYLCQECGADFKSPFHLTQHLKSHSSRKVPFRPRQRRIKTPPRTIVPVDASAV